MRSAATALHLYESVKSLVLDRRNPMPVRQALKAIRPGTAPYLGENLPEKTEDCGVAKLINAREIDVLQYIIG